jgi:hypothetical protein
VQPANVTTGIRREERALLLRVLVGIGLGVAVSGACALDGFGGYPTVAFRCDPSEPDNCPDHYFCCSDDPSAEGGALPAYEGKGTTGATPYFSGVNNALSIRGMCIDRDDIPFGSGLREAAAFGCPTPCNPTWSAADVAAVCGESRACCQTVELDASDCVLDPDDGTTFRPVTGADIGATYDNGTAVTDWAPGTHATHQDPGGVACRAIAGDPSDAELRTDPTWLDCVAQLTVANERGFCMQLAAGDVCPTAQPDYVDACTRLDRGG